MMDVQPYACSSAFVSFQEFHERYRLKHDGCTTICLLFSFCFFSMRFMKDRDENKMDVQPYGSSLAFVSFVLKQVVS